MNLINGYVEEVLSEPYYVDNKAKYGEDKFNWWAVDVKYSDIGSGGERTLTFKTKEEAEEIEEGYKFLH